MSQVNHIRRFDLDIMRSWLCNAVMLGHVFGILVPLYGMEQIRASTFLAILSSCIRINVPGFLFLAGYLVLLNKKRFDARIFLSSRARSTLPLYLIFASLYYANNYLWLEGFRGLPDRLFGGTASYHLYFIPISLQLYLLTPLLVQAIRHWPKLTLVCSAIVSYGYTVAQIMVAPRLDRVYWCLPYLIYYCWGLYAASSETGLSGRLTRHPLTWRGIGGLCTAFLISAILYGGGIHLAAYAAIVPIPNPWYSYLLCALEYLKCCLGIFTALQLAMLLARRYQDSALWQRSITFASRNSYFVYLAHPFMLMWLYQIPFFALHPQWLLLVFPLVMWLATWGWITPLRGFRSTFDRLSA